MVIGMSVVSGWKRQVGRATSNVDSGGAKKQAYKPPKAGMVQWRGKVMALKPLLVAGDWKPIGKP